MISPLHDGLLDLPSLRQLFDIVVRLGMATLLGGVVGFEREQEGKAAGLRTHVMVLLAAHFLPTRRSTRGCWLPRKWLADASFHSKRDNRIDPDGT